MLEAKSEVSSDEPAFIYSTPERRSAPEAKKPVCIVLHQEQSNPGHIGQWFRRNGHALDIRKPRYGDPLPETLAHHCGAVIFGGPMSANDKDEFVCRETEWIGVALKEEKPFLGICLGAQMLANHLGAKVGFHADELAEIGYYPLLTTSDGTRAGALSGARLPVASRGLRAGARRAAPCHIHRRLPQPGVRLRLRHRLAVPSRDHLRPGAPLDRPQQHASRHEGRARSA